VTSTRRLDGREARLEDVERRRLDGLLHEAERVAQEGARLLGADHHLGEARPQVGQVAQLAVVELEPGAAQVADGGADRGAADAVGHRRAADREPGQDDLEHDADPFAGAAEERLLGTLTFSNETGAESLPRRPSPWNGATTLTPGALRSTR
jgi:hypothetical protein